MIIVRHEMEKRRGRKPLGDKTMTPAERQQRRRDKLKAAMPAHGSELRFRLELFRWLMDRSYFYYLDTGTILQVLDEIHCALAINTVYAKEGNAAEAAIVLNEFLTKSGFFSSDWRKQTKQHGINFLNTIRPHAVSEDTPPQTTSARKGVSDQSLAAASQPNK